MRHPAVLALLVALATPAASASAVDGLRGSRASIRHQHEVARELELTFLRNAAQVRDFVKKERLERVTSTADLTVAKVSFPYTRPIVKQFLERLAAQYHAATGKPLVVTSLTRPTSRQPRNASRYSVHPAGIAVDLRIPATYAERSWLERTLLSLENAGVIDATRERRPPHYHVAVFPDEYATYLNDRLAIEAVVKAQEVVAAAAQAMPAIPELAAVVAAPAVSESEEQQGPHGPPLALIVAFGGIALALGASGLVLKKA